MGNCFTCEPLPVDSIFKFPSPLPIWLPGDGFASGQIDLGGLQVSQVTSFNKIWTTYEGGQDTLGATFYEPSPIPDGYFMLGCYSQRNNQPLFGSILVAKDSLNNAFSGNILEKPIDYTLVWSSESLDGHVWLPQPQDGYKALGHVVTTTLEKPLLEKIRCVRVDYTDECEAENRIWVGENGVNVYSIRPKNRGTQAQGVNVGTFSFQIDNSDISTTSLACLKNNNYENLSSMPNLTQLQALIQAYSPLIYFHPSEKYLPSSVNWFFGNGALLYEQGEEVKTPPLPVESNGTNLPQGGSNDGIFCLDLPVDENEKERVKKGDLLSSEVYLHVKPMFGGTFTDIVIWVFYPFNGPSTAKLGLIDIPLGFIGEHVGDWEHLTLRISNFDGVLYKVYFSEHSGGTWINTPLLEFENGNKVVSYSSLNGHAFYAQPGLVIQGRDAIGIRNDTAKSNMVLDTGAKYSIVAGEKILGLDEIIEPPWLNYCRKWGPKIKYELGVEVEELENSMTDLDLKSVVDTLPNEIFGEDGPVGPKMKSSWTGDEV